MRITNNKITLKGYEKMNHSSLTICSIVRDCDVKLRKNIPVIEKIRSYFKSSAVIVFENDSIDGTKQTLEKWSNDFKNVNIISADYNESTIPNQLFIEANKYYSYHRISKLAEFRNQYLKILNESSFCTEFVMVIDLDVSKLNINGIAHSFGLADDWDVVCANGYSYSPSLKKRYHDTYALVELGKENEIQTESSIYENLESWSFLKSGMPLIPVYSAFGGLSIYHYHAIKNKKYSVIPNNDKRVEVKCEHFSICKEIREAGYSRVFIDPYMTLKNHSFTMNRILQYLINKFRFILLE